MKLIMDQMVSGKHENNKKWKRSGKGMTVNTAKPGRKPTGWFGRDWRLYLMLILPITFYLVFCYKPMVGIIMAFENTA